MDGLFWDMDRLFWGMDGLFWDLDGLFWDLDGLFWCMGCLPAEERAVVASKLVMCQEAQDYGFFLNTSSGHQRQTEASCNKKLQGG